MHAAARQLDGGLQGRAGVQPGAEALRQRQAGAEGRGIVHAAVSTDEFAAISRPRGLATGEIGKGYPAAMMQIPPVAREDRAGLTVTFGDDRWTGGAAGEAQHPFGIGRDREPARPVRDVAQRKP